MRNFAVEQKYIIRFDDGRVAPHNYDKVIEFEKSAIGIVNVGGRINAEAYSKTNGKQLFSFFEAESLKEYSNSCIIKTEEKHFYVFFDSNQNIRGPFFEAKESYGAIKVGRNIKNQDESKIIYGVFSLEGQFILPIKYEYIGLKKNVIIVHQKGKAGMFSYEGECLLKPEYDRIIVTGVNPIIIKVWIDGKVGVVNTEGKFIIPTIYTSIISRNCVGENVFIVSEENGLVGAYYSVLRGHFRKLHGIFEGIYVYPNFPFIVLDLGNYELYYNIKLHKIFQSDCVKFMKNKIKYYMDGKWHTALRK